MSAPPPYPRIPHLVAGRGTRDDKVLTARDVAALLSGEVVVEEKLDGANVVLWSEDGIVRAGLRGGPGSADRAGQLGPLRAWVAGRHDALVGLLGHGEALYAEWLYLTHTVAYDRLPSLLFALDLRLGDGSLVPIEERDGRAGAAGLAVPPELWRGVPGSVAAVEGLLGPSRYGPGPAEGVVVRAAGGSGQMAKLLRPDFAAIDDEGWRAGRPPNRLVEEAAWR